MRSVNFLLLTSLVLLGSTGSACAQLYRWTDAEGEVHYSDTVPPQDAQRGHKLLSREGDILQEVQPRKTPEQLEAERREAELRRLRQQQRRAQELRDTTLLSTFSSVDELDAIRDQRIKTLESRVKIAKSKLKKLQGRVEDWKKRRSALVEAGKPVPKQLDQNIAVLTEQAMRTQDKIIRLYASKEEISERFRKDRARYVELVSNKSR